MTFSEVTEILRQYFIVACLGAIMLIALFCIGYFLIYRKLMKGGRKLEISRAIVLFLLTGYIFTVLYATFFNRAGHYLGSPNLHVFSSYLAAWNSFSLRGWQQLIFNIALFIPLGVLLPLWKKRFRKAFWIIGAGFLFSLSIEVFQLLSGRGSFDLDDLFNNLAGTVIGYCIVMMVLTIAGDSGSKVRKALCYALPIVLIAGSFAGIFITYNTKEFGNLVSAYNYKINCRNADFQVDIALSDEAEAAMVYTASVAYDKDSALQYAKEIYEGFGISADKIDVTQYNDNALYKVTDTASSYSLWIKYMGGTYSYTDFSQFDTEPGTEAITETEAKKLLKGMKVYVPENAEFTTRDGEGSFAFHADLAEAGDSYYTGQVDCRVYQDNIIKNISNDLILLKEYRPVEIKSQLEAVEEIRQGKFKVYMEDKKEIETIRISGVKTDYTLDSKGYYQPLYCFQSTINGERFTISIPAMK
ncbi:MAG: VanZ family protein [Eubacteriales bacterium]|nr:VanZ family protein [Eubacteriales bacterium]